MWKPHHWLHCHIPCFTLLTFFCMSIIGLFYQLFQVMGALQCPSMGLMDRTFTYTLYQWSSTCHSPAAVELQLQACSKFKLQILTQNWMWNLHLILCQNPISIRVPLIGMGNPRCSSHGNIFDAENGGNPRQNCNKIHLYIYKIRI